MTYAVVYGVYTYNDGKNAAARAEDFSDTGQRIGEAFGTWNIAYYGGGLINSFMNRMAQSYYDEVRLSTVFYAAYKGEVDAWTLNNPTATKITGTDKPSVPTNQEPANVATAAQIAAQEATNTLQQLQLKSAMLQSDTAIFASPDVYLRELEETNAEIRAYNDGTQATAPTAQRTYTTMSDVGNHDDLEADGNEEQAPSKEDSAWLLILLPVVLLIAVVAYLLKGR